MNTLYLIRHGENVANLTKEFSHRRVDYSLTAKGVMQAEQTAAWFRGKTVHALYTSPAKRAWETAAIIGAVVGLEPVVIEEFREINCGTLEDEPPTLENWALHNMIIKDWFTGQPERTFPRGECYHDLVARIGQGFRRMLVGRRGQAIIAVGHGGAFALALPALCPTFPVDALTSAHFQNCAISTLTMHLADDAFHGTLRSWNQHDHLSGEAADLVSPLPDE